MPVDVKHLSQRLRGNREHSWTITAEALEALQASVEALKATVAALRVSSTTATASAITWGDYDLSIATGDVVNINISNGINQNLILNTANLVTFQAPTKSSGALVAGEPLTIMVKSDNPLNENRAIAWDPIFKGVAGIDIDPTDGAYTIFGFTYRTLDSTWVLKYYQAFTL